MLGRKVARKTVGEGAPETVQNGALSGGEEWRVLIYGSVGAHCRKCQVESVPVSGQSAALPQGV